MFVYTIGSSLFLTSYLLYISVHHAIGSGFSALAYYYLKIFNKVLSVVEGA